MSLPQQALNAHPRPKAVQKLKTARHGPFTMARGDHYTNGTAVYNLTCPRGHTFQGVFDHYVQAGQQCPICKQENTMQNANTDTQNPYQGQSKSDLAILFDQACADGNIKKIRLLLAAGADVNGTFGPDLVTGLMRAAANGRQHAVEELLSTPGININAQSRSGGTALMQAATNNHAKVIILLRKAKANTKLVRKKPKGSTENLTAYRIADLNKCRAAMTALTDPL